MVIQLSATTTKQMYDERHKHGMSFSERSRNNPFAPIASRLLDSLQARTLSIVRDVLRPDDVRGVLRHYQGRRNACTRRTLRYAQGIEN